MKCQICGSEKSLTLFSFPNPRRIGNKKLSYRECLKCGLIFLSPGFSPRELDKIYSTQEYFIKLCQPATNPIIEKILSLRFFPEYDEFVQSNYRSHDLSLLDIGCGNGEFLKLMQNRGWKVNGADPSRVAIRNASKLISPKHLKTGKIYNLKFSQKFDAVTLWHVLEHETNPLRLVNTLSHLLTNKGKVILEVPNSDSLLFRLFKKNYNWLMVPEHIYYYSPKSLSYLFSRAGLKIEKITYPPRALLNFALSCRKTIPLLSPVMFVLSPFVGIMTAVIRKSEVVRVVATL